MEKLCVMCRQEKAIHPDKPVCMGMICQLMYNQCAGLYAHDNPINQCKYCGQYTTVRKRADNKRICHKCSNTIQGLVK